LRLNSKRVTKAIVAWIGTFAVAVLAWYVSYTDYPELLVPLAFIVIVIGAYACWQTVPSK
jgi:hypothetical protein